MYFNHAFRKDFFVQPSATGTLGTLLTGTTSQALTAGQIGLFVKTSAVNSSLVSTNTAATTPFLLIQGSYFNQDKISPALGGYQESMKSKLVNPRYISRVIKITAKQALQNIVKVPVSCGLACDTTYRLRVDVKGSPALRFLSHNMYRTLDSYTGCCSTVDPTLLKDPIMTLLAWKDQINNSPIFNTMVQARVYSYVTVLPATSATTTTTLQATIPMTTTTGILVGQKVVGAVAWVPGSGTAGVGIPPNSFVTAVTGSTSIVIKFPPQQVAPTIGAAVSMQFFSDLYTSTDAASIVGTATVIPGTGTQTGVGGSAVISAGILTGATMQTTASGALIYSGAADAASFTYTQNPILELSGAYIETKFGDCTFTPTDKYDLEPLFIYTSAVDESGDPCAVSCFTTTHSATGTDTAANLATVVQDPIQASGVGETVLRNLILSGRYAQNAYPDSSRVESLRMREIETDPMYNVVSRTALYDQVMILHSVPRFNNPSGTFDNDQYLLVVNVPTGTTTTAFTNFIVASAVAAQGTAAIALETY
jgi:hypothetical protein